MSPYCFENRFSGSPELDAFLACQPVMATSAGSNLRRSPRKKASVQQLSPQKKAVANSTSPKKLTRGHRSAAEQLAPKISATSKATTSRLDDIPLLSRNATVSEIRLTSNNRRSPSSSQRSSRLTHVGSVSLPLKALAMQEDDAQPALLSRAKEQAPSGTRRKTDRPQKSLAIDASARAKPTENHANGRRMQHYTSRFVLKEAHCNDDEENSNDEEDEEDTDLSGFIVDDDADISIYNTSGLESDDDSVEQRKPPKLIPQPAPRRRRLQQGSPTRRRLDFGTDGDEGSEKENRLMDNLSNVLHKFSLKDDEASAKKGEIEVIDLTSSPAVSRERKLNPRLDLALQSHTVRPEKIVFRTSNPFKNFDAILKFSPPSTTAALMIPSKDPPAKQGFRGEDGDQEDQVAAEPDARFITPPATPPRSPSKLKSPSKLLSPSKRQTIPHSPHRQSMDAFWDHNVINEWNDEYSPKKAPAASPGKRGLARFNIWCDSEDEAEDSLSGSSDSLPSPSSSPRRSQSPLKRPEKESKKRLAEEKRAAAARKKAFDSQKEQLALDLFRELDEKVAKGQLASLGSSTGGVKIIWSKTLRSTAGRANWKRTVTKPSGSPIKGNPSPNDSSVKVQHFASIELAEKIIDCEDRLVNTLAHEFCHLTNFMISNVRDQPHGASFKQWAQKVTSHLRSTSVPSWRKVEVTTKHSYVINHKYLWVCTGRPRTSAMEFLNVEDDEGCGAEYGRHSKSIDVEKHRCGKCKGMLMQVRPKPRATASPARKTASRRVEREGSAENSSSGGSQAGVLGMLVETIELSD